jgi:beta-glucosidase
VSVAALLAGARLTCRVPVRNGGPVAASAVVQLYLHRVTASTWPRTRELRGFRRVEVPASSVVTVDLPVGAAQLATVDESGRPMLESGTVEIQVGLSAADVRGVRLVLT